MALKQPVHACALVVLCAVAGPLAAQAEIASDTTCFTPPPTAGTSNWVDDWVLFLVTVAAPPTLLAFAEDCDRYAALDATADGVSGWIRPAGYFGKDADATGLLMGGKVMAILKGAYAELGYDRMPLQEVGEIRTYRAGYVSRPIRRAAGGIVVGYRDAAGLPEGWKIEG